MNVIQDLNKSCDDQDLELDDIVEEISNTSGCTGGENYQQRNLSKVPKLDLHIIHEGTDMTDYKQLCKDQIEVVHELEMNNLSLQKRNEKLVHHIKKLKSKNVKYRMNAKDSVNRMKVVVKKLEEYDGLNKSVFDTLNVEQKAMQLQNDQTDNRLSIFSGSDFGSVIVGGLPNRKFEPNNEIPKDEEVYATTGSSSQHRRAKSRPFMFKQNSEVKAMELKKLNRELEM